MPLSGRFVNKACCFHGAAAGRERSVALGSPHAQSRHPDLTEPAICRSVCLWTDAAAPEDRRPGRSTAVRQPREQWHTLLLQAHPGYVEWEEYEENLRRLRENAQAYGSVRGWSATRGAGAAAGISPVWDLWKPDGRSLPCAWPDSGSCIYLPATKRRTRGTTLSAHPGHQHRCGGRATANGSCHTSWLWKWRRRYSRKFSLAHRRLTACARRR